MIAHSSSRELDGETRSIRLINGDGGLHLLYDIAPEMMQFPVCGRQPFEVFKDDKMSDPANPDIIWHLASLFLTSCLRHRLEVMGAYELV